MGVRSWGMNFKYYTFINCLILKGDIKFSDGYDLRTFKIRVGIFSRRAANAMYQRRISDGDYLPSDHLLAGVSRSA